MAEADSSTLSTSVTPDAVPFDQENGRTLSSVASGSGRGSAAVSTRPGESLTTAVVSSPGQQGREGQGQHQPPLSITTHSRAGPEGSADTAKDDLEKDLRKGIGQALDSTLSVQTPSSFSSPSSSVVVTSLEEPSFSEVSDEEIEKCRNQLPDKLKIDYYDAMIVYQEDDRSEVESFLSPVQTKLMLNKMEKPKVMLYDRILPCAGIQRVAEIDTLLEYCTYTLLFITKQYCETKWTKSVGNVALMNAINNPDRQWSVVPIYTEPKRHLIFKVMPTILSLKGIDYWDGKFNADPMRKLLEDKLHVRLEKEEELKTERKRWIRKHKAQKLRETERRKQEERHELVLEAEKDRQHQETLRAQDKEISRHQQQRPIQLLRNDQVQEELNGQTMSRNSSNSKSLKQQHSLPPGAVKGQLEGHPGQGMSELPCQYLHHSYSFPTYMPKSHSTYGHGMPPQPFNQPWPQGNPNLNQWGAHQAGIHRHFQEPNSGQWDYHQAGNLNQAGDLGGPNPNQWGPPGSENPYHTGLSSLQDPRIFHSENDSGGSKETDSGKSSGKSVDDVEELVQAAKNFPAVSGEDMGRSGHDPNIPNPGRNLTSSTTTTNPQLGHTTSSPNTTTIPQNVPTFVQKELPEHNSRRNVQEAKSKKNVPRSAPEGEILFAENNKNQGFTLAGQTPAKNMQQGQTSPADRKETKNKAGGSLLSSSSSPRGSRKDDLEQDAPLDSLTGLPSGQCMMFPSPRLERLRHVGAATTAGGGGGAQLSDVVQQPLMCPRIFAAVGPGLLPYPGGTSRAWGGSGGGGGGGYSHYGPLPTHPQQPPPVYIPSAYDNTGQYISPGYYLQPAFPPGYHHAVGMVPPPYQAQLWWPPATQQPSALPASVLGGMEGMNIAGAGQGYPPLAYPVSVPQQRASSAFNATSCAPAVVHHHHSHHGSEGEEEGPVPRAPVAVQAPTTTINYIQTGENVMLGQRLSVADRGQGAGRGVTVPGRGDDQIADKINVANDRMEEMFPSSAANSSGRDERPLS